MAEEKKAQVEQLKNQAEVKRALEQTPGNKEKAAPKAETKDKLWFGSYLLLLIGIGVLYYLFNLRFFGLSEDLVIRLLGYTRAAIFIVVLLTASKAIQVYIVGRIHDTVNQFNLKRILRLIIGLVILFIIITSLFADWQAAIVSLGLVSLIFGFSLQTVLSSFIGWIYILVRQPYRIGDRIKIGDATGDVIDVGYLDTTLWEFGGEYLSTDHPSGRLIKFPNSNVLSSSVYNYSWPLFPYVWNEIKFNIAYESDLQFVERVMQETAAEEVGKVMMERVKTYRELLEHTPIDKLEVREYPSVQFRVSDNTWLEAIVRYLVEPKQAGRVKTKLIKEMLEKLSAEPDKVMFPKSNAR
jgi:small-conductance mechanosensitive channel